MVELRNCNKYDTKVKNIYIKLSQLDNNIFNILNNSGLKIILFIGQLTDNIELIGNKGITPRNYPSNLIWDYVDGIYRSDLNKIFIDLHGNYYVKDRDIFLHELGHAFDDIIGGNLFGKPISELPQINNIIMLEPFKDLPNQKLSGYYNKHPREYIANSFDMFFNDKTTNKFLETNNNKIWSLFNDIMEKIKNK